MSYPYPFREVLVDGMVHTIGLSAGIAGVIFLMMKAATLTSLPDMAALGIYAGFLLFALLASAAYHLSPFDAARPWLHKIDHAAIYFKIAATYTPFVVIIGSVFAYVILAIIWAVAVLGAVAKLSFWRPNARGSLALYLVMGWACVLLLPVMVQALPAASLWLVLSGGLLYTLGTVFFSWDGLAYQNAIWHGFVISASACFFIAITLTIGAPPV